MFKKGDLTINIIVIAVIALLVLVVMIAIFSGKMGEWLGGTQQVAEQSCSGNGGRTIEFDRACDPGETESIAAYTDVRPGFKCCLPVDQ
ncbi:MAG: hypothetical protein ACMXX8_01965 [Candidatus Woesearchaeota archaeon]